jgi:hypothetical protein
MEIDDIVAAAAKAAREADAPPKPEPARRTVSVYHTGLTHNARKALAAVGVEDDRLASVITLAKAEERAAKIAAGGFDVPWSLKREIAHLTNELKD